MFGIGIAMVQLIIAQHEEQAFQAALKNLPEEMRWQFERDYRARQEKRRQEAITERRHQELCQAIRDSRLRGIGIFL